MPFGPPGLPLRVRWAMLSREEANMTRLREMVRGAWTLIRPYWFSEDRWAGRGLLLVVVLLNLFIVYINVLLSKWYNLFYNSLQDKDFGAFRSLLIRFSWLARLSLAVAVV